MLMRNPTCGPVTVLEQQNSAAAFKHLLPLFRRTLQRGFAEKLHRTFQQQLGGERITTHVHYRWTFPIMSQKGTLICCGDVYQWTCEINETTQEFKVIFSGMLLLVSFPLLPMFTLFFPQVNFLSLNQNSLFFSLSKIQSKKCVFFSFLFFCILLQAPNSSIFIGKSKHASKLEIHFLQTKYMKKIHPHPANINSNKSKTIIQ